MRKGIRQISEFLPTQKKANPCWPVGVRPHARVEVKAENPNEGLPNGPRRGEKKIRLNEDSKPKIKVDKREMQEVRKQQLREQLARRKELFPEEVAAGRQSGEEDSKRSKSRGDAYANHDIRADSPSVCRMSQRASTLLSTFRTQSSTTRRCAL